MKYYYYDSNGNTYEITDSCQSAITKNTIIYNANNTTTYQYKINTACSFTPAVAIAGFQQEIGWAYNLAAQGGSGSSAIVVSNFTITQDATEGDQIMQNATENANRIIANQNQNAEAIIDSIVDLGDTMNEVIVGVGNLNDTLTDNTAPNDYSFFNNIGLSNDTPISNLILMPITLLNAINTGFSGTCSPVDLGTLYDYDLILPCINLQTRLGNSLWSTIDGLISIFLIYEIALLIINAFEDMTSLNDSYTNLIARHSAENVSYTPRHGGGD